MQQFLKFHGISVLLKFLRIQGVYKDFIWIFCCLQDLKIMWYAFRWEFTKHQWKIIIFLEIFHGDRLEIEIIKIHLHGQYDLRGIRPWLLLHLLIYFVYTRIGEFMPLSRLVCHCYRKNNNLTSLRKMNSSWLFNVFMEYFDQNFWSF